MRAVAILVIVCQLTTACTSWRLEKLAPAEVMQQQYPEAVRVERIDGHKEVWYRPQMKGDSLIGWWDTARKTPDRRLPLSDIRQVSTSHVDAAKTSGLLIVLGGLLAAGIAMATWDGPLGGCCGQ
ncbi:MAG TPA: hypothetical protein VH439_16870 [Gemmatimonadales bacterium]|jgi:hypothetical protein